MKKKEKMEKKTSKKVKDFSSRGSVVDLGTQQLAKEVWRLVENYSKTGEIDLPNNRVVSQIYGYINKNKKRVINDKYGVVHSFNVKAVLAKICSCLGVGAFISTLAIFAMTFGTIQVSSILLMGGCSILGWGLNTASYLLKKNNNTVVIESLLKGMEDKYGVECLEDKEQNAEKTKGIVPSVMHDTFLEEIKLVVNHAKKNSELDFTEELDTLSTLAQEYIAAKRDAMQNGKTLSKCEFLDRLTEIELKAFSKRSLIGTKPSYLLSINGHQLVERLMFMGLDESTIVQDGCLSDVFKEITRLSTTAYEGCERELVLLFKLTEEYARRTYVENESFIQDTTNSEKPENKLYQGLNLIEKIITSNINMALAASKKICLPSGVETPTYKEYQVKTI